MKINELIDYLTTYKDHGYGEGEVFVCNPNENPLSDAMEIESAVFIECKDGDFYIVLQME